MGREIFKGKYCKLVTDNGFVIYGVVTETDDNGFFFQTNRATSYYNWNGIKGLVPKEE